MRILATLLVLCVVPVQGQESAPFKLTIPEYTEQVPGVIPDFHAWPMKGGIGEDLDLTRETLSAPAFLGVLSPENICTSESLPCKVDLRFNFWSRPPTRSEGGPLLIGRFVVGRDGAFVEGIAMTDLETPHYWVRQAGLWFPLVDRGELKDAHHVFYQVLAIILREWEARGMRIQKSVPKGKKVAA